MSADPHQIRADVDAVLSGLPPADADAGIDIEAAGARLEEAHQILVDALESVEKG